MKPQVLFLLGITIHTFSIPCGLFIVNGSVSTGSHSPDSLVINASDQAILEWNYFSIDAHESVEFIQPSIDAIAINRVMEATPSQIFGQLKANGKLVLINPNGILVGRESQIDTGSFIASTLDLQSDFAAGLRFSGQSKGEIVNQGSITAHSGDLFLASHQIENSGRLMAMDGRVGLLSSPSVEMKPQISLQLPEYQGGSHIFQRGKIIASRGSFGSEVILSADTIELFDGSIIDVSGKLGGGSVLVGGDLYGKSETIPIARYVRLDPNASIFADASSCGIGGKVILWAKEVCGFYGKISAKGIEKGGFIEVSSPGFFAFEGMTHVSATSGNGGTILLDPTDVTIGGANANFAFSACPTASASYTAASATISIATLTGGALLGGAGCTVTIDTASAFGSTGNITVASAVNWATTSSLVLNASNNITVSANIQNSSTGNVTLNALGNINISPASVGSQNGTTTITCAGDLTIGPALGQIGFFGVVPCLGSIVVSCNNLNMQANTSSTQIGHGRLGVAGGGLTTTNCNITVNAAGNISMANGAGLNRHCKIGHGTAQLGAADSQSGNITVTSGGFLSMVGIADPANTAAVSIGHGPGFANPIGNTITYTGNINVQIGNTLLMDGTLRPVTIGHGSVATLSNARTITGNIRLCCMNTASLLGYAIISHVSATNADMAGDRINCNFDVSIGGDLILSNAALGAAAGRRASIGFASGQVHLLGGTPAGTPGYFNLSVCGDVALSSPFSGNAIALGYMSATTTSNVSAHIAVGGDFIGTNLTTNFRVVAQGDLNFAVGGNLNVSMSSFNGFISSGLTSGGGVIPPVTDSTTRVFVGGSLTAGSNGGGAVLAIGVAPFGSPTTTNLDVRAGGNIQWANNFATPLPGSISIQAGHTFAAGEIWNAVPSQLTSICSQTLSPAFSLSCGPCTQFTTASQAITPTCGAFSIQGAGGPAQPINFSTGAGLPLTLSSLCTACGSGTLSTLTIGAAAGNNIRFGGAPGNVGPLNLGAFNTIDINQNITSTGQIDITACHNLTLNPGLTVTSTGLGSAIVLIADVDNSGMGNLNLNGGNITSNNGPICLLAGPGTFGCNSNNCSDNRGLVMGGLSSINLTSGQVNSGSESTIFAASGDILIDGAATSVITTTGDIALTAGINITIDEDIVSGTGTITSLAEGNTELNDALISTSGEIRMITGIDFFLNGTSTVASLGNSVTLVADNQFPNPPFIGSGAFNMSCSSSISSGAGSPLRIFTGFRNSNTVCGSAMFNGSSASNPQFGFGVGPLFEDTLYEMWCVYFACPSPYPFSSLGFPFTVFYKNCLQRVTEEAITIIDEILLNLHPYNEFPGWEAEFWILSGIESLEFVDEPYLIRRRNLNIVNHPKSYTVIMPE